MEGAVLSVFVCCKGVGWGGLVLTQTEEQVRFVRLCSTQLFTATTPSPCPFSLLAIPRMRVLPLFGLCLLQGSALKPAVGRQSAKSLVLRYFECWNQRDMVMDIHLDTLYP